MQFSRFHVYPLLASTFCKKQPEQDAPTKRISKEERERKTRQKFDGQGHQSTHLGVAIHQREQARKSCTPNIDELYDLLADVESQDRAVHLW